MNNMNAPKWDLERHARLLAPTGAVLVPFGSCLGGVAGLLLVALGLGLLLAACFSAKDGMLIFGPFVNAEVIRQTRRGRPWLFRALYAIIAAIILFWNINIYAPELMGANASLVSLSRMANINSSVTAWLSICLALYVVILTFQIMPGIVAEEREAKRWDILLATDLRPREILFGKVTGRLLMILDPILAIAPVLAVTPLLGGVPPIYIAVYAVCLMATVFSITCVSMFYSVFSETRKDARSRTFGLYVGYGIIAGLGLAILSTTTVNNLLNRIGINSTFEWGMFAEWFAVGHPAILFSAGRDAVANRLDLEAVLLTTTLQYVAAHVAVGLLFALMACAKLRTAVPWSRRRSLRKSMSIAAAERRDEPRSGKKIVMISATARPPVDDDSITWWERYGHLKPAQVLMATRLVRGKPFFQVFLVGLLMAFMLRLMSVLPFWSMSNFNDAMTGIAAFALWCGCLPMIFGPLFRGAGCIAKERTQDTMDQLRLLPLTSAEIVYQKWKGVILEAVPTGSLVYALALGFMCIFYVNPITLLVLPFVLLPSTFLAASVGVFFSAKARSATRAVWYMMLSCFAASYAFVLTISPIFRQKDTLQILALFPLSNVSFPVMIQPAWNEIRPPQVLLVVVFTLAGMLLQCGFAWLFFRGAVNRFEADRTPD